MLIGATAAMFGPTIPAFRATFHLSAAAAGLLLSGHFAGSVVGTLSPGFLPRRVRAPRVVSLAATLCFALGCLVIGSAPTWPAAVGGAVVEGTGWGGLVIAGNALFASGFGARSPTMLTLLNAMYGIGAILGPAGVGLLAGGGFRGPFLTAALAALLLLPLSFTFPRREVTPPGAEEGKPFSGLTGPLAAFLIAFLLYGGLEGGIGAWEATNLVATGLSAATAATITSLFWTCYTVGRLVAAPLALVVAPQRLVLTCLAAVSVLMLAARVETVTAAAYTASGLAIAPIFPLAVVWAGRILPSSARTTSFVISADLFGGVILSALLGQLVTHAGIQVLPLAFAGMAAGDFVILLGVFLIMGSGRGGAGTTRLPARGKSPGDSGGPGVG